VILAADPRHHLDATTHLVRRWRLVAWYWAAQGAFVVIVGALWACSNDVDWQTFRDVLGHYEFWGLIAAVLGALMVLQTVMVWPVRRPRARRERGWPVWLSLGLATLVGTALSAGAALGFGSVWDLMDWRWPGERAVTWAMACWCVVSYCVIGVLIHRFCSRELASGSRHESVLGRIASTLFVGTMVEVIAIIPLDVMLRRKHDCYSWAASWWAYAVLIPAGLVSLGPAILLPLLARRRKRWYGGMCDACGYDMSGLLASRRVIDRCPECGAGWRPPKDEPA